MVMLRHSAARNEQQLDDCVLGGRRGHDHSPAAIVSASVWVRRKT